VIPREGIESYKSRTRIRFSNGSWVVVIPREGIESDTVIDLINYATYIYVIPREGIESGWAIPTSCDVMRMSDPERGN
jgi:hypothetical protein